MQKGLMEWIHNCFLQVRLIRQYCIWSVESDFFQNIDHGYLQTLLTSSTLEPLATSRWVTSFMSCSLRTYWLESVVIGRFHKDSER